MPPYSVSKMSVIVFTRIVAKELAPHGVTVNAICPGVLWTSFWEGLAAHLAKTNPAFAGMTARQVFDKRVTGLVPPRRGRRPRGVGRGAGGFRPRGGGQQPPAGAARRAAGCRCSGRP